MKWNFIINFEHIALPLVMGSDVLKTSAISSNVDKTSYSAHFIPLIYHD